MKKYFSINKLKRKLYNLFNRFKNHGYPKQFAFTLAETLITLVIIGIIAAITVPSLIAKHNKNQIENQLKKSFSTFANGIKMSEISNGPMKNWPIGADIGDVRTNYWQTYLKPFFRDAKLCNDSFDCGYKTNLSQSKWQDERWTVQTLGSRVLFQLSDGTVIFFPISTTNTYGQPSYTSNVYIDVNGVKQPNTFCKDVFVFYRDYTNSKIIPGSCAAEILQGKKE